MSEITGISRTSIQRILKHYKWHPYKIQLLHELNGDDHDRRLQFCEIICPFRYVGIGKPPIAQSSRENQFDSSVNWPSLATSSRFPTGVLLVTSYFSAVIQTDSAPPS
nr:unnamed protein product [Callosobruchus chinensis]